MVSHIDDLLRHRNLCKKDARKTTPLTERYYVKKTFFFFYKYTTHLSRYATQYLYNTNIVMSFINLKKKKR